MKGRSDSVLNKDFKLIFEKMYPILRFYSAKFIINNDIAEDIVQNSFISLWKSDIDKSNLKIVKAYLFKTVRNLCLNEIRHSKIVAEYEMQSDEEVTKSFKDELIKQETYNIIYESIEKLAPQSKKVILLTIRGYGYKEIAESLDISVNTVKLLKKNAIKRLRIIMQDYDYAILLFLLF